MLVGEALNRLANNTFVVDITGGEQEQAIFFMFYNVNKIWLVCSYRSFACIINMETCNF